MQLDGTFLKYSEEILDRYIDQDDYKSCLITMINIYQEFIDDLNNNGGLSKEQKQVANKIDEISKKINING